MKPLTPPKKPQRIATVVSWLTLASQVAQIYFFYLILAPRFLMTVLRRRWRRWRRSRLHASQRSPSEYAPYDRMLHRFCQRLLTIFKVKVAITTPLPTLTPPLTHRPILYMSNHCSMFDIPILYHALPANVRMLAKPEVFRFPLPFFSRILHHFNFLPLHTCCKHHIRRDMTTAITQLQAGQSFWVAPEGDLSTSRQLQPFKSGVFKIAISAHAIIIPLAIHGSYDILPRGEESWWALRPRTGCRVTLTFGQPIDSQHYRQQRAQLRDATFQAIHHLLNTPQETVTK